MTRCDYDTIFQRVFCVTLVAIAFTFTVILTNVFVDIDGLLSRKDKVAVKTNAILEPLEHDKHPVSANAISPIYYKPDRSVEDEDNYRSKRSLENQNFLFHVRNPKVKGILTSRLETLLEELDAEESTVTRRSNDKRTNRESEAEQLKALLNDEILNNSKKVKAVHDSNTNTNSNDKRDIIYNNNDKRDPNKNNGDEDLLHLAMHNILLQGIIGHMDLNDVYKKVHTLINNFKKPEDGEGKKSALRKQASPIIMTPLKNIKEVKETVDDPENFENFDDRVRVQTMKNLEIKSVTSKSNIRKPSAEEKRFFDEMANCEKLESDVKKMLEVEKPEHTTKSTEKAQLPSVLIKTIIDITALKKNNISKKEESNDSKERVKGIIQLIYNGKSIRFSRMDEDGNEIRKINGKMTTSTDAPDKKYDNKPMTNAEFSDAIEILQEKRQGKSEAYLNNFLKEYLIKDPQKFNDFLDNVDARHKYKSKRYKRQIKIRYQDADAETEKTKKKKISLAKSDDDELYVEIETHFDSKGMKGEKKKKLIRNLIDKIQKAIHSDIDLMKDGKKRKHKHYHIKKRTQHPLDKNQTLFLNKVMIPMDEISERHTAPISKTVQPTEQDRIPPFISDRSGEGWRKAYYGPGFLTVSKSVNSAEMGELDINYDRMVIPNDIPSRQLKPLNMERSEDSIHSNSFFNMGDLKFFIKDLDGTGLSIGFNQYTDAPPDPEAMKLFTGIENIISNYHQSDDQTKKPEHAENHTPPTSIEKQSNENKNEAAGDNKQHVVIRRSIKELNEKDYHSNEYKIIFNGNFLPYDNYEEIIEDKNKRIDFKINKADDNMVEMDEKGKHDVEVFRQNMKINELPVLMGDNIFYKKLKPSEILNLASMLNRKKRHVTSEKITNFKRKIKLNKYINSNTRFSPQKIILSKKRSKRQIDKIRIIATDALNSRRGRESEENIFVMSDENLFADRAVIRDVERLTNSVSEMALRDQKVDDNINYGPNHEAIPYTYTTYEEPPTDHPFNPFNSQFRMNPLMSRYPHIIMEEVSNEQYDPLINNNVDIKALKMPKQNNLFNKLLELTTEASTTPEFRYEENLDALEQPKQNYKLTVRILPRNASNLNSGFKEIHTSINKSFNRNGKLYSSLFNVSEISKIENLLPTTEKPLIAGLEEQQAKIDQLLRQRKKEIQDQLDHLKEKRNNIDILDVIKAKVSPKQTDRKAILPEFDMNQLVALMKMQSQKETTTQPTNTISTTITAPPDVEKVKIIDTIKRNENLTNEILQQINKNSEILQTFLMKLSDRLPREVGKDHMGDRKKHLVLESDKPWNSFKIELPFNQHINETSSVPFVYAFQPHLSSKKTDEEPLASVIYQGLIHTMKGTKGNSKIKEVKEGIGNQTKYFIDGAESMNIDKSNSRAKAIQAAKKTINT